MSAVSHLGCSIAGLGVPQKALDYLYGKVLIWLITANDLYLLCSGQKPNQMA